MCDRRSRRVDLGVGVLSSFSTLSPQHDCPGHQNACASKNRRKRMRQKVQKGGSWCGCSKHLLSSFTAA